jgi:hypothetical protein
VQLILCRQVESVWVKHVHLVVSMIGLDKQRRCESPAVLRRELCKLQHSSRTESVGNKGSETGV